MAALDAYSEVVTAVARWLLASVTSVSVARGRRGQTGGGTAVIIREDGLLVTSAHVVDGVDGGGVAFADGGELPFTVAGVDTLSDLAVLRTPDAPLTPVLLGDADELASWWGRSAIGWATRAR